MQLSRFSVLAIAAAALLCPGLAGCSSDAGAGAATPGAVATNDSARVHLRVGVIDFERVVAMPGVQIVDVRTPEEFAEGHIPGAVNIAVQDAGFADQVSRLDPTATYAVYCRSGNRSKSAVAGMQRAGITSIYELESGTTGWVAAGKPLVR
jgi:rhodanese-related sulfurtransferase